MTNESTATPITPAPSVFAVLKPYKGALAVLITISVIVNVFALAIPKLTSHAIDAFMTGNFVLSSVALSFCVIAGVIVIFTYAQGVLQTYVSECVARDLRNTLIAKISRQSYTYVQTATPSALLTNLTSDIDAIKLFVSQAIVALISSALTITGSAILLLSINGKLGLAVLGVIPLIGGAFFFTLSRVRTLFTSAQKVIDWLNNIINESILGAGLIRVLNGQQREHEKFTSANAEARTIGLRILNLFATLIPVISFLASTATLIILVLGGHYVMTGGLTLGDFAAFNTYLVLMIFPIFVIGFAGSIIARATASYARVSEVLTAAEPEPHGTIVSPLQGAVAIEHVNLAYGETPILKDVSLVLRPGSKTAIIGPTAAGKSQLLYILTGLLRPTSGTVQYDGVAAEDYDAAALHRQVGFVFQDSIMFNLSIRENIAFSTEVQNEDLEKAIEAAELTDYINALPQGLDTIASERGASLSGGQKQRIMLARALALNPKILLLDDFTARVDANTEKSILDNIARLYPGITLLSVTQKIASVEHYDQIVLLMEGEILAVGTHVELMSRSPEYVQIFDSQRSTNTL